jgi:uncharacterized membrane protein
MTMTPLSKRLIIALVISVAVNLLFAGLFAGAALHRSRMRAERGHMLPPPHGMGPREGGPRGNERRPRARDEPGSEDEPERREGRGPRRGPMFGGLLADEMRPRREEAMKARAAVHDALVHEPFDPAALDRSLTALRAETTTTQDILHKKLVELSSKDAATRAKLAQGFERWGGPGAGPP